MPHASEGLRDVEHRRHPRYRLGLPVQYKFIEQGSLYRALESHTENFSERGSAFRVDRSFRIRQHILVTLYLPVGNRYKKNPHKAYPEENLTPIMILAEVVWCGKHNRGGYEIGVEFLTFEPEHLRRFREFLKHAEDT